MFPRLALVLCLLLAAPAEGSVRAERLAGPVTGEVLSILDGDTVEVRLNVWIGQEVRTSVRIAGIDAPEIHGKCEKERGMAQAAKAELARILSDGRISLKDIRLEKYAGRVLASATAADGTDIGRRLLDLGLARAYGGKKRKGWCG